jgi:hypothetical protein
MAEVWSVKGGSRGEQVQNQSLLSISFRRRRQKRQQKIAEHVLMCNLRRGANIGLFNGLEHSGSYSARRVVLDPLDFGQADRSMVGQRGESAAVGRSEVVLQELTPGEKGAVVLQSVGQGMNDKSVDILMATEIIVESQGREVVYCSSTELLQEEVELFAPEEPDMLTEPQSRDEVASDLIQEVQVHSVNEPVSEVEGFVEDLNRDDDMASEAAEVKREDRVSSRVVAEATQKVCAFGNDECTDFIFIPKRKEFEGREIEEPGDKAGAKRQTRDVVSDSDVLVRFDCKVYDPGGRLRGPAGAGRAF